MSQNIFTKNVRKMLYFLISSIQDFSFESLKQVRYYIIQCNRFYGPLEIINYYYIF